MHRIMHPDVAASGKVADLLAFRQVYAPRGWVLMDEPTSFANDQLGRFIRSADELTKDEARALTAVRGGEYPDENATGAECIEAYNSTFGDRPAAPPPVVQTPSGIPIKPYDPAEHNVDGEDGVLAYLQQADEAERFRVLELEESGKNRKTVTEWVPVDESAPAEEKEQ